MLKNSKDEKNEMSKPEILFIAIAVIILVLLMNSKAAAKTKTIVTGNYDGFINSASARFGVPSERIIAHIIVESRGNPNAVGTAGERGLMQLKPGALKDSNKVSKAVFGFVEMFDPEKNIIAGTAYLAWIERYFFPGDWDKVSRAYNQGVGRPNNVLAYVYLAQIQIALNA
jgi:soluble lytic murein transglycosylase-like protein